MNIYNIITEAVAEEFYGNLESSKWSYCSMEDNKTTLNERVGAILEKLRLENKIVSYDIKEKGFFQLGTYRLGTTIVAWCDKDLKINLICLDHEQE